MAKNSNEIIFKYRAFNSTSLEMLINKQLWFADPDTFNDPFDCRLDYSIALKKSIQELDVPANYDNDLLFKSIGEKINKARVCCFSQTKKNQLMWAHYADDHKGFCIGFNTSDLLGNGNNLKVVSLPVEYKYDNPYQDITKDFQILLDLGGVVRHTNLSSEFLRRALATKYIGWKYEKEIRLISTISDVLDFQTESINSITFGLRMQDNDKQTLKKLLAGREWEHLKWFETTKAENCYALNFNSI